MHRITKEAWDTVLNSWEPGQMPTGSGWAAKWGHLQTKHTCEIEDLTAATLYRQVQHRMKSGTTTGTDGWRAKELKLIPEILFEPLALLLNLVEKGAQQALASVSA